MKVTSSTTANLMWTSYIALLPATPIGLIFMFRLGVPDERTDHFINQFGAGAIILMPILAYAASWIGIYFFRTFRSPMFIVWQGEDLIVGYRTKRSQRISVSDIKKVERINPTKPEQVLKFHVHEYNQFKIALSEYDARAAVKRLKEAAIEVEDVFLNQPGLVNHFDRKHKK